MKLTASNASVSNTLSTATMTLANTNIVESITLGNVSITPAEIDIGNVIVTPTLVSVPSLAIGGTLYTGVLQGGIINYQEFSANGTWYNPYANASVNASLTGYEQVLVMAWGGGGGATSNNTWVSAGGGGACVLGYYTLSQLGSTVSVTVGLGGTAARTTTTAMSSAGAGGNTSFGSLVAYGGGGGVSSAAGGGGGTLSAGSGGTGGSPLPGGAPSFLNSTFSTYGGGGGPTSADTSSRSNSLFGGGAGSQFFTTTSGLAGFSIYGGGGGGAGTVDRSGFSIFGGSGGALGGAGNIPGGGGSGNTSSSNTGARGEVRVWVFGPAGTTAGAPTYSLTANTTTLVEGSSVLYTVSTTNVSNGTALYYTLNNSSTAVATDFTTAVNGSVVINGGTGTFTLSSNADADFTNETIIMDIRTNSLTGPIVANNGSVSLAPIIQGVYNGYLDIGNDNLVTSVWQNAPISTASSDRKIVAVIGQRQADGLVGINTANSVTIGGVTATLVVSSNQDTRGHVDIWIANNVSSGSTANVNITWNNPSGDGKIVGLYSLYGANSTAYSTASAYNGASPTSANVNVIGGGFVIAMSMRDGNDRTANFTAGVDANYTGSGRSNSAVGIGSRSITTTQINYTVTATNEGSADMSLAVASFQPG